MKKFIPAAFVLIASMAALGAEVPDSLNEILPEGTTPQLLQRQAVLEWATVVDECNVMYDVEGNVVRISVKGAAPGVDAELFRDLRRWPELQTLHVRHQRPTRESLSLLVQLPKFEGLCLMNIGEDPETGKRSLEQGFAAELFPLAPRLRNLDLVHTFGYRLNQPPFDQWPEFPALERLVLEGGGAKNLELFAKTPALRVLGLHRTSLTAEDFARFPELLPNLKVLMIKPRRELDPSFLVPLTQMPHLETLAFHHWTPEKLGGWEGLQVLVNMPQLKRIVFGGSQGGDRSSLEQLLEARPDLEIISGNYGPPVTGSDGRLLYSPRDVDAWTLPEG